MSNACSCVYVDNDGDPAEFVREVTRRAWKEHKCTECDRIIAQGEEYESVTGKWDRHISTFKTCGDCLSVRAELFCGGWILTRLWEDVREHILCSGGISSDCLARLSKGAREMACEIIEEMWEDDDE